jgi:hypothetical protein
MGFFMLLPGGLLLRQHEVKLLRDGKKRFTYHLHLPKTTTVRPGRCVHIPLNIRLLVYQPQFFNFGCTQTFLKQFPKLRVMPAAAGVGTQFYDNFEIKIANVGTDTIKLQGGEPVVEMRVTKPDKNQCPLRMVNMITATWKRAANGDTFVDYKHDTPYQMSFVD